MQKYNYVYLQIKSANTATVTMDGKGPFLCHNLTENLHVKKEKQERQTLKNKRKKWETETVSK